MPTDVMGMSLNNHGPSAKQFEAILYGPGYKNHIVAKISKQFAKKTVHVDETLYQYSINVSVKHGDKYEVFIPKL